MNDTEHSGDTAEFEDLLRTALNADVDAQLGSRRAAPPFDPTRTTLTGSGQGRRAWLMPLLAAACVALLAGVALAVGLFSDGTQPPVRPVTPAPTTTPAPDRNDLDGAHIVLPRGWVARPYARWAPKGTTSVFDFCLSPRSLPVRRGVDTCPLAFTRVRQAGNLDPDVEGGFTGDPHPCGQTKAQASAIVNTLPLGGRPAAHLGWSIYCRATHFVHHPIQYVVVTDPAYILYTSQGGRDAGEAMDYVAAHSQLPEQDAPLPLFDRGIVTAATTTARGVRIKLRRVSTPYGTGLVFKDHSGKRYSYLVPTARWQASGAATGNQVTLHTDGHRVQSVQVDR